MSDTDVNKKYKDRIFRFLFGSKENKEYAIFVERVRENISRLVQRFLNNCTIKRRMFFQVCCLKNAGVAGYVEALRIVQLKV